MPTLTTRPRTFYPALDGLRAVAFLCVFTLHYGVLVSPALILRWGWVGVDLFFVLSGFLITGILYDSLDSPHYFRDFYIRRSLRIFPLFYTFWLLVLLLTPLLSIQWNRYNFAMSVYFGNFFYAGALARLHDSPGLLNMARVYPHFGGTSLDVIPFWSLCIEEQFYLVWPGIVWLLRSRTRLLSVCLTLFIAEPFLRELYWRISPLTAQHGATYFNTFTRVDTLLTGAALALWLRGGKLNGARSLNTLAHTLIFVPLAVLALLVHRFSPGGGDPAYNWLNDHVVNTLGFSLIALTSAGLLLLAIQQGSWLFRLLHTRPLLAIGRRSYGLYLIHALPLFLLASHGLGGLRRHHAAWLFIPIVLLYTFTVGWLSFRYLESPFLRLKDRLAPKPDAVSDPQPI